MVASKASDTAKRMTKPQASKNSKTDPAAKPGSAPAAPSPGTKQLAAFEAAMKVFHARKFKEARELCEHAAAGPERDLDAALGGLDAVAASGP